MINNRLTKLLFDWMGVFFACCLIVLALTGVRDSRDTPVFTVKSATDARVIVIDAGHGGADGGADSSDKSVKEAGINLQVAKLVESELREAGFTVVMTRSDENALGKDKKSDMKARREIMRQDDVAAVVSIHMNKWRDTSVKGPMAFYMKGSGEAERLATAIITDVCKEIGTDQRLANPGDYYVLRESICPAVIIECGFMSNADDLRLLQDEAHQIKLAKGIVNGITRYFSSPTNTPGTSAAPGKVL